MMDHALFETRLARKLAEEYGREIADEVVRRVAEAESLRILRGETQPHLPRDLTARL